MLHNSLPRTFESIGPINESYIDYPTHLFDVLAGIVATKCMVTVGLGEVSEKYGVNLVRHPTATGSVIDIRHRERDGIEALLLTQYHRENNVLIGPKAVTGYYKVESPESQLIVARDLIAPVLTDKDIHGKPRPYVRNPVISPSGMVWHGLVGRREITAAMDTTAESY